MHVKVCPRLSLMYAIPQVFGLWSLVFGLNTLNPPNPPNPLNPYSKKRACP
jgi:hypothetical protein